ncbi:MAG TPA: sensor histidine kinase [Ruminiclostridium sp.]|nr:sensor histidine kinase [Ruminiclostridium sp.]
MKIILFLKEKISEVYYTLSIKNKISLSFIFVFSSLLLLLIVFVYNVSSTILINKTIDSTLQNLRLVSDKFDIAFDNVENYAKAAIINDDVQEGLKNIKTNDELGRYSILNKVSNSLDTIIAPRFLIDSMIIYDFNGNIFDSGKIQNLKYAFKPQYHDFGGDFVSSGHNFWQDTHDSNFTEAESKLKIITYTSGIINADSGQPMGVLETNVTENYVSQLYSHIAIGESGKLFIINKNGEIVSDTNKKDIYTNISSEPYFKWAQNNEGGRIFTIGGVQNLVICRHYDRLNWIILGVVPTREITQDKYLLINRITFIGLAFILLAVILIIFIANSITRPIIKLKKSMEYMGDGDLEVTVEVRTKDEVGSLAEEFNRMIKKTSALMDSVYIEQKRKKEYELALLQSQINPHFLYNTLESICGLAVLDRTEDIIKLTDELALFYRGVLSKGSRIVTIRDELNTTESYLKILQLRYGEKFDYSMEVDESLYDFVIIKLTLQPIVENSIYHGLRNKPGKGSLKIKGCIEEDRACIYVIDNGSGIRPEDLERIFAGTTQEYGQKSFGLKSTDERIKLYFGSEYGLQIESVYNEGTTVKVILPAREMWGGVE